MCCGTNTSATCTPDKSAKPKRAARAEESAGCSLPVVGSCCALGCVPRLMLRLRLWHGVWLGLWHGHGLVFWFVVRLRFNLAPERTPTHTHMYSLVLHPRMAPLGPPPHSNTSAHANHLAETIGSIGHGCQGLKLWYLWHGMHCNFYNLPLYIFCCFIIC